MAREMTYEKQHNGIPYIVHTTSIDRRKTPIGRNAVPKCTDLEMAAELVAAGYFTEERFCKAAMDKICIDEQDKSRRTVRPQAQVTSNDACEFIAQFTPEEFAEYQGNPDKLKEIVGRKKKEQSETKDFDPNKITWLEPAKN